MGKVNAVLPNWKGLLIAAALTIPASGWSAVESVSANFVSTATTIQGNGGTGFRVSFFALPAVTPVAAAGKVSAVGSATLTDVNANWRQGQFNGTNGTYYVEFDSGLRVDILGTDGATKTLTLANSVAVSPGNAYRVRKYQTIADVFGKNNEAGLTPGNNSAQADNVLLHIPQSQQLLTLFYSNVPGFTGWYLDNYTPGSQIVINPEMGVMVRAKSNRTLNLYLSGVVKDTLSLVPIYPGFNLVGTLKSQHPLRLSELSLFTGDIITGLAGGNNPATGDNLILLNPDATTTTYFYSDFPGFEGWYDISYRAAGNVTVNPGAAFFIQRKAPRGAFYWPIPAE